MTLRSFRFSRIGESTEIANQANRCFAIHVVPGGKYLAKVFDREGRRHDFVGSQVCESRDDAVAWLKKHRIGRSRFL